MKDTSEKHLAYRQKMKDFIKKIDQNAKNARKNFIIIPQNGLELLVQGKDPNSAADQSYLKTIQGVGRENLFFGLPHDDKATAKKEQEAFWPYLKIASQNKVQVLAIDYTWTPKNVDQSLLKNQEKNFLSFAAPNRDLNSIPTYPEKIPFENKNNITKLSEAKNFLYLINPEKFSSKLDFIQALAKTNYDTLIVDLFVNDEKLDAFDVAALKEKANGAKRLVICYMSIGEAETYRWYWKKEWQKSPPTWLENENPEWKGNYKVKYWHPDWQSLIYGKPDSYLSQILNAGFDGVYLDIVDAFWHFENQEAKQEKATTD